MKAAVVTSVAVLATMVAAPPAFAAPPAGACEDPEPAGQVISDLPWAQRMLDPDRVWPRSTGSGVTVAVIDSGVDADHPQLAGKVLPGRDFFLVGTLPGNYDCDSHGTAVASIIAADPAPGVGFHGVAPGARILPVRVTDRAQDDNGQSDPLDPGTLANGIRYAADQGARVINLSLSGRQDFPAVHDAIGYAQAKGALIVAAAGNRPGQAPSDPTQSYPAQYDGVLGVGAIDNAGNRADESQTGPYVDIVAPGKAVVAAHRVRGHDYWDGTSFAAPFVAATAALVWAAWPQLTAQQVASRLIATADLAPGGLGSMEYGAGVVDPYRAVTEGLSGQPAAMPPVTTPRPDPAAERAAAWWQGRSQLAGLAAIAVLAAILLAAAAYAVVKRGRPRRWLPATAVSPPPQSAAEPPEQRFLFPHP